ncbi:MAG TPA: NAD-dependent epimerase/dehydratase family protein [Xanthobacteraceae bacterium]|nr:NAD-dependent epimerase/dehydratase family protein [Xanthobacteraceae bacterium]
MKVLITGGMGVIGAETSRKFVKEGHRPVIFARHRDESLIGDIADKVDIELGDVLDMPRLLQAIKAHRVTHVVHTAAFVGAVSAANPALSVQVNVMGVVNVLEAARAFDVKRVVYTSAKGVYGPVLGEYGHPIYKPMPEDMPKNPKRIYDSAKLMGENVGIYYDANMGIEVVVLRFASTYGPGKTARHGAMGVTSRIVENPARGLPFRIEQGGDEKDDFIYNKDSANGIYLATMAGKLKSRIFNIGTGVGATLRDFEAVIRRHIPNAVMEIGPGLNFFGFPYPATGVYDISRARDELGYRPEYDLERGIADYLQSLKRLGG